MFSLLHSSVSMVLIYRYALCPCSSASERDEWLKAISRAINDYTKKKISFIPGKPLEEVRYVLKIHFFSQYISYIHATMGKCKYIYLFII